MVSVDFYVTDKITPLYYPGCLLLLFNCSSWHLLLPEANCTGICIRVAEGWDSDCGHGIPSSFWFKLTRTSSCLSSELIAKDIAET